MAHSSVEHGREVTPRLRSVRPDGTPVYRYEQRPGSPPVAVVRFDADSRVGLPPSHRHAHDFLVLVFVEEGSGSFSVAGAQRLLRAGQVHAVPPGQVVEVSAIEAPARCRGWSVAFTPDAVPALAALSPLVWARHPLLPMFADGAGPGLVPTGERARWSTWLAELAEELADPGRLGARDAAAALLTRILVEAARLAPPAPDVAADPLVERVLIEVEATFRRPVSATDVARALGYTPGHLTTVVRERTGRTLLEWITERRMTEVRRLLRDTDLTLGVIAARTGLRDAGYLGRRFRDRHGITPQQWRRSQRATP
jgi:AraC-like DNA-binding protein